MYPEAELKRLAAHKASLRDDIVIRRGLCVASATRVLRPLAELETGIQLVRRLAPLLSLGALPLAGLCQARFFPKQRVLGAVLRWGPLAFGAVRKVQSMFSTSGARD